MLQAGVAGIKGDATVEGPGDLHFCTRGAEAARLLGGLEATAFPFPDGVVADHALVDPAAKTVEALRSGTPRGGPFARLPSKTAVVVGDELAQHGIGGVQVQGSGQTQFTAEAILQHAP